MEGSDPDIDYSSTSHLPGDRVKLNVGGKLFETTTSTLLSGGPDSLLAALSDRAANEESDPDIDPIFIDRDPEIFTVLLSLLRSGVLPSAARRFSTQDLVEEAQYYGVEPRLRSAMSPPPLLGVDAALAAHIRPAADGLPTALSAGPDDGSVWIAHGGQISVYDWALAHTGTVRTHLNEITSLCRVWPEVVAVGSSGSPGLHSYDVYSGRHAGSAHWSDPSDPRVYKATVSAIAAAAGGGGPVLFAAFECPHRENCILEVDRGSMRAVSEIGRQSGGAAKTAVAGKLVHVAERGLVFASAVSRGAFGYAGYMRLWDPRSGEAVWEVSEPGGGGGRRFGDFFSDADVDLEGAAIYKVCWKSGDVGVADMRMLGDDPWTYLEEPSAAARGPGSGEDNVVLCYKGGQVFVGRGEAGLEVWSRLGGDEEEDEDRVVAGPPCKSAYRRNYVDMEEDARRGRITRMEGGGDRLFLCRDGMEGVEVWESSQLSGAIPLSSS